MSRLSLAALSLLGVAAAQPRSNITVYEVRARAVATLAPAVLCPPCNNESNAAPPHQRLCIESNLRCAHNHAAPC